MDKHSKKLIYFVLGNPGAGKGTFCQTIVDKNPSEIQHFSAGDLLRGLLRSKENSEKKKIVLNCIKDGIIVPVFLKRLK